MNIKAAKQQIKDTVEAYLTTDEAGMFVIDPAHQRPIFLLGAPGIGKTAVMEQVAAELGVGIMSYSMTHHTRQSALGLPRIEHREFEGFEFDASEYTMSEIVAALYDYMERTGLRRGILFLDEINCVSETLYPSMLQFLQFKTFGKHRIPDGWVVACAGNPPEYNRSVHEFDIVTLDRLREIDVEPDYGVWKDYAVQVGLHPAVTTFLETKRDCFYKVESKPGGGKSFVTARGWEDLARVISLYEQLGKTVNRDLVVQFLRDDEVADQFAVYYALLEKYRSDYQVGTVLEGEASAAIKQRAKDAAFDERLALIGLVLDALSGECARALDREDVVVELRDVLRAAKPELLAGASVEAAVSARATERESMLARKEATGVAPASFVRKERLTIAKLKDLVRACALEEKAGGPEAFSVIQEAYRVEVAELEPLADAVSAKMDNAFDFVDECFGTREVLVFMAELATRKPTTRFIARYGNSRYYERNAELQVDSARMGLVERASLLDGLEENIKLAESRTVDMGSSAGLRGGSASDGVAVAENDGRAHDDAASVGDLAAYYGGKQFEYGFASLCKMVLPASELKGKRVLDVCCRRGKGVYKLSSMVGRDGFATGVDWSAEYVADARRGMDHAWRKSGLPGNNMEFLQAYPEDLMAAGVGTATMDAVYINNVMTLLCDQLQVLKEIARVLKPGGLLVLETVFADRKRDEDVIEQARRLGNSIQAARTREENLTWLIAAGFDAPEIVEEYEVDPARGFEADCVAAMAEGDADVRYSAVAMYVRRK